MNNDNKNDVVDIICIIIIIISAVTIAFSIVNSMIFMFKNPDMTSMRLLIENPKPVIIGVVAVIIAKIVGKIFCRK